MPDKLFSNNVFKAAFLLTGAVLLLSQAAPAFACKIGFVVVGDKKEVYKVGENIDVKLNLEFTHRRCPIALEATDFEFNGLEITKASDWLETVPNKSFEKELKLKVTGNKEGKLTLSVTRKCDLGGGSASIAFKSEPTK